VAAPVGCSTPHPANTNKSAQHPESVRLRRPPSTEHPRERPAPAPTERTPPTSSLGIDTCDGRTRTRYHERHELLWMR
jgi:hypothetical protein